MKVVVRLLLGVALATALAVGIPVVVPELTPPAAAAGKIDKRCKVPGRVLCADKTRDKLYYLKNGRVLRSMDARFGCRSTPTRQGRFRVFRKSRHHVSSLFHTSMPLAMFFSGGQAVHYSPDFARHGYSKCSHGCVNIRVRKKLRYVYSRIRVGDRVVVYRS